MESLLDKLQSAKESFAIKEAAVTSELQQEHHNRIRIEVMRDQRIRTASQ